MEFFTVLRNALIPTFLLAAGIVLLFLALRAREGGILRTPGKRQYAAIAIGIVLLLFGISLFLFPKAGDSSGLASAPVIMGVTLKASQENNGLVFYQRINFYDEDGNTDAVKWELVDLSDPSQRQYIKIQSGTIEVVPEVQKIRASITETWHCEGHSYTATVEVFLSDKDGNRSKPVRYTIACK